MTFRNRLQYLLVKKLQISNKAALQLIIEQKIEIDGVFSSINSIIIPENHIVFNKQIIQLGKKMVYIAYYKPRGIETTLNPEISDNLKAILKFETEVFPVGRLDKASEGLLILTNDGRLYDKTLRKENQVEKEYLVTLDREITEDFIIRMSEGITIMGKKTLPCKLEKINDFSFKIILVQGLNRQIRRMCYKLNYEVSRLIRIRVGSIKLENLQPNEWFYFVP
jgi:23S rRNA pseudouridine2604 synthase